MDIRPIVLGTAGHIDHGKSSLVRALTGVDPDRLPEEKARGLTIDLGFAPLELLDGRTIGIVDVPGHERFLRNMVAGATGIDLVMLVVAADDGVMPQTREHLQIMQILGLSRGLVALNKTDLVEPEMAELAALDVRELLSGTFLEGAPIVPVSAHTGAGLERLRAELSELADSVAPRSSEGVFRLPIQRVFSARGFGTIVTGIPVSGEVGLGETLEILPVGRKGKVRSLQAYMRPVERARAGHSTAVNLTDVEQREVLRGMVAAAPGYFRASGMVAVRLDVVPGLEQALADRTRVRFHTGTADPAGELVLLERERLEPGESGLAQVRLDEPVVCAPGDRYVLRLLSPERTLGGGVVLEESRWRLKRGKQFVLDALGRAERSLATPQALLEAVLLRRAGELLSADDLALEVKRPPAQIAEWLAELGAAGRARTAGRSGKWLHAEALEAGLGKLAAAIERWFGENPTRLVVEVLQLKQATGLPPDLLQALLEEMAARGALALEPGGRVRPRGREGEVDPRSTAMADRAHALLAAGRFQPPSQEEIATGLGIAPKELRGVLQHLADQGRAVHVGADLYFSAEAIAAVREAVERNCRAHGHLEIPALRDELGTTRKYLIPLLEQLDAQGVTIRQGANRVLKRR